MHLTASRNGLQVTPAEARGALDFEEEAGLGQQRRVAPVTSALLNSAVSILAIRYAVTGGKSAGGWRLGLAWFVGLSFAFSAVTALGSAVGGGNKTETRAEV